MDRIYTINAKLGSENQTWNNLREKRSSFDTINRISKIERNVGNALKISKQASARQCTIDRINRISKIERNVGNEPPRSKLQRDSIPSTGLTEFPSRPERQKRTEMVFH
jgi:hypothetical protein